MHGKMFVLDSIYAGIDESHLYARLDFASQLPEGLTAAMLHIALRTEEEPGDPEKPAGGLSGWTTAGGFQLEATVDHGALSGWELRKDDSGIVLASARDPQGVEVALGKVLEMKLPMALLGAEEGDSFNLRFVLYRGRLPVDALPEEGSLEIQVAPEDVLAELSYGAQ